MEIKLLGQRIPLKTSGADHALAKEVVDLVSAKIEQAEKRLSKGGVAPHQVALLALLDLAEDYVRAKHKTEAFKTEIEERSTRLLQWIESELK